MEQIEQLLNKTGINLTFGTEIIKGIPGFDFVELKGEPSYYDVEKQDISFMVSTSNVVALVLVDDDSFTFTDKYYLYTCKIVGNPIADLTGLSLLHINIITKTNVPS